MNSLINVLAERGVISVAAAGNNGTSFALETPLLPAAYPQVISVGSHDGNGNPSSFSQNSATGVHILADGENFPLNGNYGTSYATPQVAATVTVMQAVSQTLLGRRLVFDEVVDVLPL
jgi:subtilisin family serine protease